MPTLSVLQIVQASLRTINAVGTGETLTADQANDGMQALNLMLGGWADEGLTMVSLTREVFTLISTQAAYTMGPGGDFDTVRPEQIDGWFIRDAQGNDYPMVDIIGEDAYREIPNKTNPGRPDYSKVDYDYPLVTLTFYPVPDTAEDLHLDSIKPLGEYTNLTTTIALPPQYLNAFKWNLAVMLAPEYSVTPSPIVMPEAHESKTQLISLNAANRLEPMRLNLFPRGMNTVFLADIRNG